MQHTSNNADPCAPRASALPWVEKHRPTTLSQIVHHDTIVHLLKVFMRTREMPHLFFYGPPGTGKTSTILSCAREIYGKHHTSMVLHLNASDERGIDVVRKRIIQFASTSNMFCQDRKLAKLVILDEADSMTPLAQLALRDIMMVHDTLFCLIGNYQYALLPPLQSRVVRLLFTPIPKKDALLLGQSVLEQEGHHEVRCSDLEPVYTRTGGDMRQFLNVLQAIAMRPSQKAHDNTTLTKHTTELFSKANVMRVLCQWEQCEVDKLVRAFRTQDSQMCFHMLHESIVHTHSHTLRDWIGVLAESMLSSPDESCDDDGNIDPGAVVTTNTTLSARRSVTDTLEFCTNLANIEHNSTQALHPDVQLFALVGCCHKYAHAT
jgi:hypothetical protein